MIEGVPAVAVSVCGHWLTKGREVGHGKSLISCLFDYGTLRGLGMVKFLSVSCSILMNVPGYIAASGGL